MDEEEDLGDYEENYNDEEFFDDEYDDNGEEEDHENDEFIENNPEVFQSSDGRRVVQQYGERRIYEGDELFLIEPQYRLGDWDWIYRYTTGSHSPRIFAFYSREYTRGNVITYRVEGFNYSHEDDCHDTLYFADFDLSKTQLAPRRKSGFARFVSNDS